MEPRNPIPEGDLDPLAGTVPEDADQIEETEEDEKDEEEDAEDEIEDHLRP